MSRLFLKAIPEAVFKYFSKASAFFLLLKLQYQIISQGLNWFVYGDFPQL